MNRRQLLTAMGVLSAGGAAVTGTGAFTSVAADRDVTVRVADDESALLAMQASPGPNGAYATTAGDGTIALEFTDTDTGGSGVGLDSVYDFDDVFRITNQGTQTVYVWVTFDGPLGPDEFWLYPNSDPSRRLQDGDETVVELAVGDTVEVGAHVDTRALSDVGERSLSATVQATVDRPADAGATQPDGDLTTAVVSESPTGEQFGSINEAIDSVTGSTVIVESGTYEENLAIGSPDAGTDAASAPDANLRIVGRGDPKPTIDGYVQVLDPNVTIENVTVADQVFDYGLAVFEPGVVVRDVRVTGATNGLFVPSADVRVENCVIENYSFYGAVVSGRNVTAEGTPTVIDTEFDGASGDGAVGVGVVQTAATLRGNRSTGHHLPDEDGAGMAHFSGTGVDVREHDLANNDDGMFFAGPDAGTVTATRNDVVGNRVGVANEGDAAVDATACWWGATGGPEAADTNGVEGPVTFEPWSTAPGPDWNDDGTEAGSTSEGDGPSLQTASVETTARSDLSVPFPPTDPALSPTDDP
jgi:hypothetical protein